MPSRATPDTPSVSSTRLPTRSSLVPSMAASRRASASRETSRSPPTRNTPFASRPAPKVPMASSTVAAQGIELEVLVSRARAEVPAWRRAREGRRAKRPAPRRTPLCTPVRSHRRFALHPLAWRRSIPASQVLCPESWVADRARTAFVPRRRLRRRCAVFRSRGRIPPMPPAGGPRSPSRVRRSEPYCRSS